MWISIWVCNRVWINEWWRRSIGGRSFSSRRNVDGRIIVERRRNIHGRLIGIQRWRIWVWKQMLWSERTRMGINILWMMMYERNIIKEDLPHSDRGVRKLWR
jgi:hypothetical protein